MVDENIPRHIALILDGNRRWAKAHKLPIKLGHKKGAETLEKIVKYANKIGIKYITAYAFSTENWKRSEDEVSALMTLLKYYLDDYSERADMENIKVTIIGEKEGLNSKLQASIERVMKRTENNTGVNFIICLNYGGRLEITRATQKIAQKVKNGEIDIDDIDEEMLSQNMYTANIPDPDLMIRTSGELRTSNFLPWQLVYSEFLFVDKLWPDFSEEDLDDAIEEYQKRNRKFGAK